ncbi:acyltransferase [bacterium]|nr:acyltransferase [bacterium]
MEKTILKTAVVQFEHQNGNKQANLETIETFVKNAAGQEVQLIAFPECCITGYWFLRNLSKAELMELAEPVFDGPSSVFLLSLAKQYDITVGAGLVEVDENCLFNTYVVAMPDGKMVKHRKIHTFVSEHMHSGDRYTVFDTPYGWNVGILTCYDNNIVENVRMVALQGADLLLAPHQTGGCNSKSPFGMKPVDKKLWLEREKNPEAIREELRGPKGREWIMRWLPSRAHDNGLFILFSNGIGVDDDEIRTGNSAIFDPYGRILVETDKAGNDMIAAELDPHLLELCTGRRWMRTRRPELYALLMQLTGKEQDTRSSRFGLEF